MKKIRLLLLAMLLSVCTALLCWGSVSRAALSAFASAAAPHTAQQPQITFTTDKKVGETITLQIKAIGKFSVKGAKFVGTFKEYGKTYDKYKVQHKNIILRGDVRTLVCNENKLTRLDVSKNTKLEQLYCSDNQLTSLDVSKNTKLERLVCSINRLANLDVSKNTKLERLDCSVNRLANLDVSKNTLLLELRCDSNKFTNLDVSKNTELELLWCAGNKLISLDVSKNTQLENLYCSDNQLTSLDVSKNTKLEQLACSINRLANLDISENAQLQSLSCSDNQLTSLDVSENTQLGFLECKNNAIERTEMERLVQSLPKSIDAYFIVYGVFDKDKNVITKSQVKTAVDKGWYVRTDQDSDCEGVDDPTNEAPNTVEEISSKDQTSQPKNVGEGSITFTTAKKIGQTISLYIEAEGDTDVEGAVFLHTYQQWGKLYAFYKITNNTVTIKGKVLQLHCYSNRITQLDVTKAQHLYTLECYDNQLTQIDVTKNPLLRDFRCQSNQLTSLNISQNPKLYFLRCDNNPLTTLDISKNTLLQILDCRNTKLTNLNTSNNPSLTDLVSEEDLQITK